MPDCDCVLTGDGQVTNEVVTVARREPFGQAHLWELSTNDWSGLEGSVSFQMTPELERLCQESLLLGVTVGVIVLRESLDGQILKWGHIAGTRADK